MARGHQEGPLAGGFQKAGMGIGPGWGLQGYEPSHQTRRVVWDPSKPPPIDSDEILALSGYNPEGR